MPFDTTYNFISPDKATSFTLVKPGGKDTLIDLPIDQLANYGINDPILSEQSIQTINPYVQTKDTDSVLFVIALILIVAIIIAIKKYTPGFIKLKELRNFNVSRIIIITIGTLSILLFMSGQFAFGSMSLVITLLGLTEFKNEIFYPDRVGNSTDESSYVQTSTVTKPRPLLRYKGSDLNFTDVEIDSALTKRFPYYVAISTTDKERFIHRVKNFIADKIFYIHDVSGFKEMPILISAAAIQLTFGLKK